jgi:hypothetical protein
MTHLPEMTHLPDFFKPAPPLTLVQDGDRAKGGVHFNIGITNGISNL